MGKHRLFYGILLSGLGLILLIEKWDVTETAWWYDWPTILIIVGAAFVIESMRAHLPLYFLPGLLMVFFGIQFHLANFLPNWPDHTAMYIALIGLAILTDSVKTKNSSLVISLFLILVSLFYFFEQEIYELTVSTFISPALRFLPILLIGIGLYYLLVKKR